MYGGAFDPPHFGHLRPLFKLAGQPGVGQVSLLPCGEPASAKKVSPALHRLAMLRTLEFLPGMMIDTREVESEGSSFTTNTLEEIRMEVGEEASLAFILGQDAYADMPRWFRSERILELVHCIVIARPGAALSAPPPGGFVGLAELMRSPSGGVCFYQDCQMDISATKIRKLIAEGQSPYEFLPAGVWDYIRKHHLYGWCQ